MDWDADHAADVLLAVLSITRMAGLRDSAANCVGGTAEETKTRQQLQGCTK